MTDDNLTYEQLLEKVSKLETENSILKTQKELLSNNTELIVWGTNTAIWEWNYKTGVVNFSDKKAEMLGYKPDEIEPNVYAFTSMIHPDDYNGTMDNMRKLLSGASEIYEVEYRIKAKNGEWKWFYDKGKIVEWDLNTKPHRIVGIVNDITDKKNALIEIKKNKEKYREDLMMLNSIFESPIDIIIFSLDKDYCYTSFTKFHKDTIKNIWGVDIEKGMNMLEIISNPVDREKAKRNFDRAIDGQYFNLTEEYGDKALYRTFYENYYCPVRNSENKIIGVSVFVIDVSFRKKMETELIIAKEKAEESEERHKFLFDNTIQGVVYQNTTGEIVYANKSAERILGISIDKLQGRLSIDPNWKAIHDDGSEYHGEMHPAMLSLKTGKPVNDEIMGVFNPIDNDYKWIKINSIPKFLKDEAKAYMVITTFEDITEIRRTTNELIKAKEKAEESELKYRLIAENTSDGIIVLDKNNQVQFVSPSYIRQNGYSENEELLQNAASIYSLIHPEDRDALFANIFGAIEEKKEELIYTYRAKHKNGHYYWREDNAKFNYDKDGNYYSSYVICRDITERKKIEQELINAKIKAEESEEKYKQIFDNTSNYIFILEITEDDRIKMIALNPTQKKLLESLQLFENINFENTYIQDSLPPDIYNFVKTNYSRCIVEQKRITYEEEIFGLYFETQLIPIKNSQGRVHRIIGISNNITETRTLTNQLVKQNEMLKLLNNDLTIAKEKAEESEIKYRLIAENTSDGIFVYDKNIGIQYASPSYLKQIGISEHESIFQNSEFLFSLVHPEERDTLFANIYQAIENRKEELTYTFRVKHQKGHYIWREDNAKFNYDKDGNYLNSYVICRDITDRKKNEQDLLIAKERAEESENLFRIFIQHSSSGETLHNTAGKLLVASASVEKITGFANQDIISGKVTFLDICYNDDKENCSFIFNEAIAGRNFRDVVIRILTPSNFIKYLNITINQIFLENSERYGFRLSILDVTEKIEAEKLAKSLLKAVESTQASVFILNTDFEIEYINPFFSRHTGYNQNEIIGNKYISFHSSVQQNQNYNSIYEVLKKGNTWEGEILKEKKDASIFIEQVTISPIKNEQNIITHFVGVGTDITFQKELDKKIIQTIIQTEEKERERFARDLHDGIGPTLSIAKLYVQCLSNSNSKMTNIEIGSSVEELLQEAQRSVRQISYNLSPLILQSFGLIEAIKSFTSKLVESSNIKTTISSNWSKRLNSTDETILYRVLCECINNTIKHAFASEIQIEFYQDTDSVDIVYSDNGNGFNYKEIISQKKGSGFFNIQSRLKIINATFDVQSSLNTGSKILIHIDNKLLN